MSHGRNRRSSRRYPHMPPIEPGHSATVLVALATRSSRPDHTNPGKVIIVPPPATALIAPASIAAVNSTPHCVAVIDACLQ
jgi:hypothetical protein